MTRSPQAAGQLAACGSEQTRKEDPLSTQQRQLMQAGGRHGGLGRRLLTQWEFYLFLLPAVVYLLIFAYGPMYGLLIAFKDFKPFKGILGSDFVGLKHFNRFFGMSKFPQLIGNTVILSLYSLLAGFPLPIILALSLNASSAKRYARVIQTVTYAPHFVSTVIVVGMINILFSPSTGIIKNLLNYLGLIQGPLVTLMEESSFRHLYVWSGIWQNLGWSSIIYLGALSAVDTAMHEAAIIDGASKMQRVAYIDFPSILPTVITLLILNVGRVMNVGFEKVFLMQNSMNIGTSETIQTYIYKIGIKDGQYSLSAAIGMFNSVINFGLLIAVNALARRTGETSLW